MNSFKVTKDHRILLNDVEIDHVLGFDFHKTRKLFCDSWRQTLILMITETTDTRARRKEQ